MMAWIVPRFTKKDLGNNRQCFYVLLRATAMFVLVAASIACYYFGSRYATQHGKLNDIPLAVYVTNSPVLGNIFSYSPKIILLKIIFGFKYNTNSLWL